MNSFTETVQKNKYLLTGLIFGLALFLRFYGIEHQNIWFDESYSWNETLRSTSQIIIHSATSDVHPPLYYVLLRFWVLVWGDSTAAMRSLSVLFSMGAMVFVFLILKHLKKDNAILPACLLMALSPYQIYFSQEIRMYSLLAVLNTAAVYYYLRLMETRWNGWPYILGFAAAILLGLYTHLAAVLTTGGIAAHFLYQMAFGSETKAIKKNLFLRAGLTVVAVAVLYLPWIIVLWAFQAGNVGQQGWRDGVTIFDALYELSHVITSPFLGMYFRERILLTYDILSRHMSYAVYAVYVMDILLFVINALLVLYLTGVSLKGFPRNKLLTFAFFVPLVGTCVVLLIIRRHYDLSRYLFSLSPILMILFAIAVTELRENRRRVISILLGTVMIICLIKYYATEVRDSDHRPVVAVLNEFAKPNDGIFLTPASINHMYSYYLRQGNLRPSLRPLAESGTITPEECASTGGVWLAMDYRSELYWQPPEKIMETTDGFKTPVVYDFFRTKIIHWERK